MPIRNLALIAWVIVFFASPAPAQITRNNNPANQPQRLESPTVEDLFKIPPPEDRLVSDPIVIDSYNKHGFEWSFNISGSSKDYGPGAVFYLRVRAGAVDETPEQRGAAMLLTRLMSSGSDTLSAEQMAQRWAALGVDVDRTPYAFAGPKDFILSFRYPDGADRRTTFVAMGELVVALLGNLTLDREDVEAAKDQILAQSNGEQALSGENLLLARIAPDSPFASRVQANTLEAIRDLSYESVVEYYNRWFRPDNARLIGIGTFSAGRLLKQVDSRVLQMPEPEGEPPARVAAIPPFEPGEPRVIVIPEADREKTEVSVISLVEPIAPLEIYGDLYQDIRQERAMAIFGARLAGRSEEGAVPWEAVGASTDDIHLSSRFTRVRAAGEHDNWRPMLRRLITEIRRAQLHGFGPDEKREDMGGRLNTELEARQKAYESIDQAGRLNNILEAYRDDGIPLRPKELREIRFRVMRLTSLEELNQAFNETLDLSRTAVVLRTPIDSDVPSMPEIQALVKSAISAEPDPIAEQETTPVLLEEIPEGGEITEVEFDEESGVWSAWLDNGIRVHHRPMPDANELFHVHLTMAGGLIEETEATRGLTDAASLAWSEQRTHKFTPQELDSIVVGSRLVVNSRYTGDTIGLTAGGDVSSSERAFQSLHLLLNDWKLDPDFLEEWKRFTSNASVEYKKTPESVINKLMSRAMFGTRVPHLEIIDPENAEAVTHEKAVKWFERFIGSAPAEIGIAGDMGYERAFELARTYFGGLPERPRISASTLDDKRTINPQESDDRLIRESHESPMNTITGVLEGFEGVDASQLDDVRNLRIAALALGSAPMPDLAERYDLSRIPAVFNRESEIYPGYGLFATVARAPNDLQETISAEIRAIYQRFAEEGPDREKFDQIHDKMSRTAKEAALSTNWWAGHLSQADYRGRHLNNPDIEAEAYDSLTPEDVRATFAKYFTNSSRIQIVVPPAEPAEQQADPDQGAGQEPGPDDDADGESQGGGR